MLVHIKKLLGRMTGIQFPTGLEETEHSPLTKPLCSDKVLISTADQEQGQVIIPIEFESFKNKRFAL